MTPGPWDAEWKWSNNLAILCSLVRSQPPPGFPPNPENSLGPMKGAHVVCILHHQQNLSLWLSQILPLGPSPELCQPIELILIAKVTVLCYFAGEFLCSWPKALFFLCV